MNPEPPLPGATRDFQSITADWMPHGQHLIAGVLVREVRNVPKHNGYLTEIFRAEWSPGGVDQVFQVVLNPGCVSAWHTHLNTTDRLFVASGLARLVLYDARPASVTCGLVNEFLFGTVRPALVVVPPGVWHGVQALGTAAATIVNIVDRAYEYESPDHWRLAPDTTEIPFRFPAP